MKRNKLKLLIKILAIIVICLISFVGIYIQNLNTMKNVVKDYALSKDLTGYRQIILEVSDEVDEDTGESVNSDESKTAQNYELAKSIIEKRLSDMTQLSGFEELKDIDVEDYSLSLDKQTGKIYLQIPETTSTDFVVSNLQETANFEIKDSKDGTVYLTNNDLKKAESVYNTTENGTIVYLELEFNKNGTEILKNLSENEYATISEDDTTEDTTTENTTTEENTTEENTTGENATGEDVAEESAENTTTSDEESTESEEETETTQKEITLSISGNDIITTSFDTPITDGIIDLSMNSATTDTDSISEYMQSTTTIAILLNNGALPLTYTVTENQYVETDISMDVITNVIIVVAVIFVILLIYMAISKKSRGLLAALSFIGFTALYLLLIRYTNVVISLESIVGGILVLFINYVFSLKLLNIDTENKKLYNKEYLKNVIKLLPAFIISIVFTLTKWTYLSSFGMIMFWGIILIVVYNILVTRNIVD